MTPHELWNDSIIVDLKLPKTLACRASKELARLLNLSKIK